MIRLTTKKTKKKMNAYNEGSYGMVPYVEAYLLLVGIIQS
jgi:hypothetical protein